MMNVKVFKKGIIEGFFLNAFILISYFFTFTVYPIIIAIFVKNGNFSDVPLFYEMWFINAVNIVVSSLLFFIPCQIGGTVRVLRIEGKRKNTLGQVFLISTVVYISGLFLISLTIRREIVLYSYDLITYSFFLLFTILRWRIVGSTKN
jgi:hypothetical protein